MVGLPLSSDQRAQCFLRLSDGGLGFGSASQVAQAAFLGSWALALKDVADSLGVNSWEGFRSRCGPLASTIADAESKLLADSGGNLQPMDWIGLLSEPKAKLQSFLSAGLQKQRLSELRASLSEDDQVDLRTAGGPGAGVFVSCPLFSRTSSPRPCRTSTSSSVWKIACVCLSALRVLLASTAGGTAPSAVSFLTRGGSTR